MVPVDPEADPAGVGPWGPVHAGGRGAAPAGAGVSGARPHRRHLHAATHRQLRRGGHLQGACTTPCLRVNFFCFLHYCVFYIVTVSYERTQPQ